LASTCDILRISPKRKACDIILGLARVLKNNRFLRDIPFRIDINQITQ
jgi:hypothetical protein